MTTMTTQTPVRHGSEKRQRPEQANTRLSSAEMERLRQAAAEQGLSVSDFVRRLVLEATRSST